MIISPSILSADFANLQRDVERAEKGGAEYIHIDVMDGEFVPNLTIGAPVVKALRPHSKAVFDVHLMIIKPERYIDDFAGAGSDIITFHIEAAQDPDAVIDKIKSHGIKAAASVKPGTDAKALFPYLKKLDMVLVMTVEPGFGGQKFMADMMPKVELLKAEIKRQGLNTLIEIDGGVNAENIGLAAESGTDIAVAGSSVYGSADIAAAIKELKERAKIYE